MSHSKQKPVTVLVTRPAHQSAGFVKLLQSASLAAIELPSIEINFSQADLTETQQSDLIIFTSANAVTGANKNMPLPWNSTAKIAAIGSATASALEELGCQVDILPSTSSSTEALLDVIGEVANFSVSIVRGDSGREMLYKRLKQAGAKPRYQSVYKRQCPEYSETLIKTLFKDGLPDIITVTSDLGLTNLLTIIPPELNQSLLSKPLVVNSTRCAQLAADKGFSEQILVADPPGDDSQLQQVLSLL